MKRERGTAITFAGALVAGAALLLVLPETAHAHGGVYQGPSGRVPPDAREPSDPPPPPWGSKSWDRVDQASLSEVTRGYADWTFWWERNRGRVLTAAVAGRPRDVDRDEVRRWITPALRRLLHREINFDISSAAALALARIGDRDSTPKLESLANALPGPKGKHAHRVLDETSLLALGILDDGAATTTRLLRDVRADPERNANYARAFAALGLAIREQDGVVGGTPEALILGLSSKERKPDARPAALAALGVLGGLPAAKALRDIALHSETMPEGVEIRPHDRAAAIAALGVVRGGGGEPVDALLQLLDGESHMLRREVVLALGSAAGRARGAPARTALERLIALMGAGSGRVAPEHVVQAIGRMAAGQGEARAAAAAVLTGVVRSDTRSSVRATAAVCLGIAARAPGDDADVGRAAVRGRFTGSEDARERAACALSLGLIGDHEAVPALRQVVSDTKADGELRGYAALALGLLGSGESEILALADASVGTSAAVQAHLALGLLGGDAARSRSMEALRPTSDDPRHLVMGAAAWAMGVNPDMDSVADLVAVALDPDEQSMDVMRALAAAAVGRACARDGAPTFDALRDALPYRALTPAFMEFLTIL